MSLPQVVWSGNPIPVSCHRQSTCSVTYICLPKLISILSVAGGRYSHPIETISDDCSENYHVSESPDRLLDGERFAVKYSFHARCS